MAYQLINGAQFLHIPKTGGRWVRTFLEENQLIACHRGHVHSDFDRNLFHEARAASGQAHLKKAMSRARLKLLGPFDGNAINGEARHIFRFCFVRHPLRWYESFWKYMKGRGWNDWGEQNSARNWHVNSTLNGLGDDDFNEFVRNVIQARPGYVTELYYAYTKPGISFIGRTENLRADLEYVLDTLGLEYDREAIQHKPRVNVSKTKQTEIEWDPQLKRTVTLLELPALVHFGYLEPEEFEQLGISERIMPNQAMERGFHAAFAGNR